jgi:hypothetical protein
VVEVEVEVVVWVVAFFVAFWLTFTSFDSLDGLSRKPMV